VRYADDFIILKRSRKAAERAMESVSKFVEGKLFLRVNREKSYVARITGGVKYLGYSFYAARGGEVRLCVHAKSMARLKDNIRETLSRSSGRSYEWRMGRLREIVNGWVGYFRLADMRNRLRDLDKWLRRKIRCLYWKNWKRIRTRYRELRRLGMGHDDAFSWACSRKGCWRIAGSAVLSRALNNAKLEELGWPSFLGRYLEMQC
jgi:hypothetical protein